MASVTGNETAEAESADMARSTYDEIRTLTSAVSTLYEHIEWSKVEIGVVRAEDVEPLIYLEAGSYDGVDLLVNHVGLLQSSRDDAELASDAQSSGVPSVADLVPPDDMVIHPTKKSLMLPVSQHRAPGKTEDFTE